MAELLYRIRDFFWFTKREIRDLTIVILVLTFIFAYNDKSETFVLAHWLMNYLKVLLIVVITMFIHLGAQRIFALRTGLRVEFQMWSTGLFIGLMFTFLTGGKWYIILPGGLLLHHMAVYRIGHFRYGLSIQTYGLIAALGPIANLVFATFFEELALHGILPGFFHLMAFINLYYAVFSFLPFPRSDGLYLFFASRLWYVFFFGTLIGYILLYSIHFYSLIFALLFGGLCWLVFLVAFERKAVYS